MTTTKVTHRATDVSAQVVPGSIKWGPREIGARIGTASLELRSTVTNVPEDDDYLAITDTDGITKVFSGLLRQPDGQESVHRDGSTLTYPVAAQGWAALLFKIPITTLEEYAAGLSDRYIVADLLTKYYGPVATSVTHRIYAARHDMPAMRFTPGESTLGQALDRISKEANGAPWWVDPDKALHWNDIRRLAPFIIATAPDAVARESFRRLLLSHGPTFHLRLAETSGLTAADASGNGNTATWNSQPALRRAGAVDDECFAVLKSADAQYASLGDICDFAATSAFSVGLWYRPSAPTAGRFLSKEITDGGGRQGWLLDFDGTGLPRVERWLNSAQDSVAAAAGNELVAGWWYLIVATYDGTNLRLYINGVLRGGPTASAKSLLNHANPLVIGAHSAGSASGAGALGDYAEPFAIPSALTATQVADLYAARVKRKIGVETLTRMGDTTQRAARVRVVGDGVEYTATDWSEVLLMNRRRGDEPGAPSLRIPTLPDHVDFGLTTAETCQRRAFSLLANQARQTAFATKIYVPGAEPGMRVDIISDAQGTGARGSYSHSHATRWPTRPSLASSRGRFTVHRVTPSMITGRDDWQYELSIGDYLPTPPTAIAQIGAAQSVDQAHIKPGAIRGDQIGAAVRGGKTLPRFSTTATGADYVLVDQMTIQVLRVDVSILVFIWTQVKHSVADAVVYFEVTLRRQDGQWIALTSPFTITLSAGANKWQQLVLVGEISPADWGFVPGSYALQFWCSQDTAGTLTIADKPGNSSSLGSVMDAWVYEMFGRQAP